jgi:alcohol dehydrogenase class IV
MSIFPFQHLCPTETLFGPGRLKEVGNLRHLRKVERVALLSDPGVKDAGIFEKVENALGKKAVLVDTEIVADGDVAHVEALAEKANALRIEAVVAVGGGSVMDSAKAMAALMKKGGSLEALEGFATVRAEVIPVICIPTTAGTGSEASQFAVIKDHRIGKKRIVADRALIPTVAILDPEVVLGLPERITVASGVDALTHALEALASKMRHPMGEAMALEALRLMVVEGGLAHSLQEPDNLDARARMLVGAHLAGQAVSTCMLGACHAFAHALGAKKGVAHGVGNGIFLVPVMQLNAPKAARAYARVGALLGGVGENEVLVEHAIEKIDHLVHEVAGIPRTLGALGVAESDIHELALEAFADADLLTNPVPLPDVESVERVIHGRI